MTVVTLNQGDILYMYLFERANFQPFVGPAGTRAVLRKHHNLCTDSETRACAVPAIRETFSHYRMKIYSLGYNIRVKAFASAR